MSSENEARQNTKSNVYELRPDEAPSEAVITAVADATDQPPVDLEPLFDTIDPGSLDTIIGWNNGDAPTSVSFEYVGYEVTVSPAGVRLDVAD